MVNECKSFEALLFWMNYAFHISVDISWNRRPQIWIAIERQCRNQTMFVEFLLSQRKRVDFAIHTSMWEHKLDWFDSAHVTHFTNEYQMNKLPSYFINTCTSRIFRSLVDVLDFFLITFLTQSTLCCNTKCHRMGPIGWDEENWQIEFLFFSRIYFLSRSRKIQLDFRLLSAC